MRIIFTTLFANENTLVSTYVDCQQRLRVCVQQLHQACIDPLQPVLDEKLPVSLTRLYHKHINVLDGEVL